jgi:hypothetical protein
MLYYSQPISSFNRVGKRLIGLACTVLEIQVPKMRNIVKIFSDRIDMQERTKDFFHLLEVGT